VVGWRFRRRVAAPHAKRVCSPPCCQNIARGGEGGDGGTGTTSGDTILSDPTPAITTFDGPGGQGGNAEGGGVWIVASLFSPAPPPPIVSTSTSSTSATPSAIVTLDGSTANSNKAIDGNGGIGFFGGAGGDVRGGGIFAAVHAPFSDTTNGFPTSNIHAVVLTNKSSADCNEAKGGNGGKGGNATTTGGTGGDGGDGGDAEGGGVWHGGAFAGGNVYNNSVIAGKGGDGGDPQDADGANGQANGPNVFP
jgi:hypothetical protein